MTMNKIQKSLEKGLFVFLFAFTTFTVFGQRDTAIAVVVYGDEYLMEGLDTLSMMELRKLENSLPYSNELTPQLEVYLHAQTVPTNEIFLLVDSLFELPNIPFPLINQLYKLVALRENNKMDIFETKSEQEMHPAEWYYEDWNTDIPHAQCQLNKLDDEFNLVLVGTKSSPKFVMPVQNVLTSKYGWRKGRMHKGIDIDVEVWDPVVSAFSGMVRVAKSYGGYGRVVVIRHFNGLETLYAHLHRIKVVPGQIVEAGELIGLGGSSGHSTGSHLHWEVRFKGFPIDPLQFIDYDNQNLISTELHLKKTESGFIGAPEGTFFHTVQNGDYLYKIAEHYGTSVSQICRLNSIERNTPIYVGQKLRVI
jgi:murein DD-endopeptidase MepM/ murein hydrolase activator NlpD